MSLSAWIRESHRWLAVAFTIGFIVNLILAVSGGGEEQAFWVYLLALIPLFLLLPTGLYMFVLPYAARWQRERRSET